MLHANRVSLGYGADVVVENLDFLAAPGLITTLIGPNGCGKSTLLRALARLLKPRTGSVLLDGELIHHLPTKDVARRLGLLSQHSEAPDGITVADLVRRGRYPHRGPWEALDSADEKAVDDALQLCGVSEWRHRPIDELSGGQRQRVWIALTVAQQTPLVLMDEPTTYLDPQHQQEVLSLIQRLHSEGRTIVLVLHDLVQAAAVSHRIVAMKHGAVAFEGSPREVLTAEKLRALYGVGFEVVAGADGAPVPIPFGRIDFSAPLQGGAPSLQALAVAAGYGRFRAVGPVDLSFGPGGFTAVLGPNGGGKSTLLRSLAGLHPLQAGEVRIDGTSLKRLSVRELALRRAFLSQDAAMPPGFTVADLTGLGRFPHRGPFGRARAADHEAVKKVLVTLDLESLAGRAVDQLSGGQRQRVWLALALAQGSPLLLLDEPTSFLDPGHQIDLLDALWDLTREGARTVVAILHDPVLAARYADKVVTVGL